WLDLLSGPNALSGEAARTIAQMHSADAMAEPVKQFAMRLEEDDFRRIQSWTTDQRRMILAELQSMRRLEFLMLELNRWLAQVPGASTSATPIPQRPNFGPVPVRPE